MGNSLVCVFFYKNCSEASTRRLAVSEQQLLKIITEPGGNSQPLPVPLSWEGGRGNAGRVDKKFEVYYNYYDNFPVWAYWSRKGA
jgi:hypothetical protein